MLYDVLTNKIINIHDVTGEGIHHAGQAYNNDV